MQDQADSPITAYRPGYEIMAETLLTYVTSLQLEAGGRLPTIDELCHKLGGSRTVMREAIRLLTARGYLRARRGSGLFVAETSPRGATIVLPAPLDPQQVLDLCAFRMVLEEQAVRLAAHDMSMRELRELEHALHLMQDGAETQNTVRFGAGDETFHFCIAHASRNVYLEATLVEVKLLLVRLLALTFEGGVIGSLPTAVREHQAIYTALCEGQADEAAACMRAHLQTVMTTYREEVRQRLALPAFK